MSAASGMPGSSRLRSPSWIRSCAGAARERDQMDIHEYQAKELLAGYGVPIQRGAVAYSPEQASFAASELGGWHWAVKAQIHSGARGKAGGIKLCKTYQEVRDAAKGMLGKKLVTHQTGPEGKLA